MQKTALILMTFFMLAGCSMNGSAQGSGGSGSGSYGHVNVGLPF